MARGIVSPSRRELVTFAGAPEYRSTSKGFYRHFSYSFITAAGYLRWLFISLSALYTDSYMSKKPFYITTTLPYVNAEPHIGFAMEIIRADVIVRYKKLAGQEVFFNTGTDEH